MKPNAVTCLLLIFCVMNLFFGCSQRKAAPLPELERAEAVMFDHPDSALRILESMPMPTDEEQHALWCLLVTQAKYKQYLPIPSDSLIRIAYDYYKPTDDARRKAMAALYMGGVNYELKNIEEAMTYYLEAKDEVAHTDDYTLGYLVMSSLGDLYLYRDLTDYALEVIQKSYDYAVKTPHFKYKAYALRDMARVYTVKDQLDSTIVYYTKAIAETQKANLSDLEQAFKNELASVYVNNGEYQKALDLSRLGNNQFSAQSLYSIGVIYMNQKKYDSAYFYLTKALNTPNIYRRTGIYQSLLHLSRQPQYQKYMISLYDSLCLYEDSVQKLDKSKEIIMYRGKYEKEKLLTEKQQLELEKAHTTRLLLASVILVLVLTVLLISFYSHRKAALHRREEELNRLTLRLRENELQMERNRRYISELEVQAAESREAVGQLQEQKERLASLRRDNESLTAQLLGKDPWLSSLRKKPVYLDESDTRRIRTLTDRVYTDFCRRLSDAVPSLSDYDLTVCCLVKLGFPVGDIAVLSGISSSSASTSKLRVKKKIYESLSVTDKKSLDRWIGEF